MSSLKINEAILRENSTAQSYQRGESYFHQETVADLCQRGDQIFAEVEGSAYEPYQVTLFLDEGNLTDGLCNCPYADSFDGWCKHIIAVGLTCLHQPGRIIQRPSLTEMLDKLDLDQTRRLVGVLLSDQPSLIHQVDRFTQAVSAPITPSPTSSTPTIPAKRNPPVETLVYQHQAQRIMNHAARYWDKDWEEDPFDELTDLLQPVQALIDRGDAEGAIAILEAITETCAENWHKVSEYDGESETLIQTLDPVWAEAILNTEFGPRGEIELQLKLEQWESALDGCFEISAEALRQGWDTPALVALLQGQGDPQDLWPDGKTIVRERLTAIRLQILSKQGDFEEYLNLAQAEEFIAEYLLQLIDLDRIPEAVAAHTQLEDAAAALKISKVLREKGALDEAMTFALWGLDHPDSNRWQSPHHAVALWTSELAEALNQPAIALRAGIEAFKCSPKLHDYQRIQALAGDAWEAHKPELLKITQEKESWQHEVGKVDIFLHEGLIDAAIATVEKSGTTSLVQRVMQAALSERPDWVITEARKRAEAIMTQGRSDEYQNAVAWLKLVRSAYLEKQQPGEWQKYKVEVGKAHHRKRKLMGLMQDAKLI